MKNSIVAVGLGVLIVVQNVTGFSVIPTKIVHKTNAIELSFTPPLRESPAPQRSQGSGTR